MPHMHALLRSIASTRSHHLRSLVGFTASFALLGAAGIPSAGVASVPPAPSPVTHFDSAWLRADAATRAAVPYSVVAGTARKVGAFAPTQKLRLVLALQPRDPAGEQRFLDELQ